MPKRMSLFLALVAPLFAGPLAFQSIDYPGAVSTEAFRVNNANQVVGRYTDAAGNIHGFLYDYNTSTYTSIDYPGATQTVAFGINNIGMIAGYFRDSTNRFHGFILESGDFDDLNYPGAYQTRFFDLSDIAVVGIYNAAGTTHPFLCDISGCYALPEVPGGSQTFPYAVNNSRVVAGYFRNAANETRGFLYDGSSFTILTYSADTYTYAEDINNLGLVVGARQLPGGAELFGFSYSSGVFTDIVYPGAVGTDNYGINDLGVVVGVWYDASGGRHGYIGQIPEPETFLLVALGLTVLGIVRRRGMAR